MAAEKLVRTGCGAGPAGTSRVSPRGKTAVRPGSAAWLSLHSREFRPLAFRLIRLLPRGRSLHYLFQRHLTHTLPASDDTFLRKVQKAGAHFRAYSDGRRGSPSPGKARFYEFGAGFDLIIPIALCRFGIRRQVVTDIEKLARPDLLRDTIRRMARLKIPGAPHSPVAVSDKTALPRGRRAIDAYLRPRGVEYRAPVDPIATGLPDGSFDFIHSTDTLEHVPAARLAALLGECHRLLRPGGRASFFIDYRDHDSYSSSHLSPYGFLSYSEAEWAGHNTPFRYQSRLRHDDYLRLLQEARLRVVRDDHPTPSESEIAELRAIGPHREFRDKHGLEDLAILEAHIVAEKQGGEE